MKVDCIRDTWNDIEFVGRANDMTSVNNSTTFESNINISPVAYYCFYLFLTCAVNYSSCPTQHFIRSSTVTVRVFVELTQLCWADFGVLWKRRGKFRAERTEDSLERKWKCVNYEEEGLV